MRSRPASAFNFQMGTIVTLAGAVDAQTSYRALCLLKGLGISRLEQEVLSEGRALDVSFPEAGAVFEGKVRETLSSLTGIDIFVQADTQGRRKKMLVADMDATMIEQETLDALAAHMGLQDRVIPITEKAMRGEIDFQEALDLRVGLLKGMPVSVLSETLAKIRYSKGAKALVQTMRRFGAKCILVSGGFDFFTRSVALSLGFDQDIGNRLEIEDDRLTGRVLPPVIDKHAKVRALCDAAAALGLPLSSVIAVGDGANDIPMLKKAGAGVSYFGKPSVVAATSHHVRHTSLESLLFMQGYTAKEIDG